MKHLALGLLLFVAAVVPFVRAVRFDRINLDDTVYLPEFGRTTEGLTRENVWAAFGEDVPRTGIWMPLTTLAYLSDYALGGREGAARVAHAGNIVLHGLNAILVFCLLRMLLVRSGAAANDWIAVLGALLWAVHPLRCESVVWIASKKDVLSAFFFLLALISWIRFGAAPRGRVRTASYLSALVFLMLGACCKPSVMVFIGFAAAIDFVICRRKPTPALAAAYLAPTVLCLAIAAEAFWAQGAGGSTQLFSTVPLWWRLVNAATSCGVYLIHTVLPTDLACQCIIRYPALPRLCLPALAVAAGTAWWGWRLFLRWRTGCDPRMPEVSLALAGLVLFFGALVPFLGISGFGYHAYADRFTYLPALGLSVCAVGALSRWSGRRSVSALALAAIAVCGALSVRQTAFWRDDVALWERTLAVDGASNLHANLTLASWHWDVDHDLAKCIAHFERAWAHNPKCVEPYGVFYMAALAEAGEAKKADELLKGLKELASDGGRRPPELRDTWICDLALALAFSTDAATLKAAERTLADVRAGHPEGVEDRADYLYVAARLAELRGARAEAEAHYRKCRAVSREACVYRFRYLGKEDADGTGMER